MSTTQIAEHAQSLIQSGGKDPYRGLSPWHRDAIIEARRHAKNMVLRLVHLANNATSEAVQRQAAADVLDRALGKAHQSVSVDGAAPRLMVVVVDAAADRTSSDEVPAIDVMPDDAGAVTTEPAHAKIPDLP